MIELLAALSIGLSQDPPPHLEYMEEAETLGRASVMGGVCVGLGIVTGDQTKLLGLFEDFQRRAVIAHADGPFLEASLNAGIERERAAVELMLSMGADDGSERRLRLEKQAADYFEDDCADLTLKYPDVFKMVED